TVSKRDWSSDVCSSDLAAVAMAPPPPPRQGDPAEPSPVSPGPLTPGAVAAGAAPGAVSEIDSEATEAFDVVPDRPEDADTDETRSEERRVGKECRERAE